MNHALVPISNSFFLFLFYWLFSRFFNFEQTFISEGGKTSFALAILEYQCRIGPPCNGWKNIPVGQYFLLVLFQEVHGSNFNRLGLSALRGDYCAGHHLDVSQAVVFRNCIRLNGISPIKQLHTVLIIKTFGFFDHHVKF